MQIKFISSVVLAALVGLGGAINASGAPAELSSASGLGSANGIGEAARGEWGGIGKDLSSVSKELVGKLFAGAVPAGGHSVAMRDVARADIVRTDLPSHVEFSSRGRASRSVAASFESTSAESRAGFSEESAPATLFLIALIMSISIIRRRFS